MHRHPPRHGAGRNISTRSSRRSAERLGEDQGRRSARRGHAHGRARQRQPARRRPRRRSPSSKRRARASSPAIPTPSRRLPGGAFLPPVLLRTDDPVGDRRGPRLRAVRPGLDDHALQGHGRRDRARQPRPGSLALSLFTHSPEAAREFVQGAAAYHGRMLVLEPRPMPRNRPATARRCRCSSTAARAAPAAARRWAACAA